MAKSFDLEEALPWGRSLAEYRAMFALEDFVPRAGKPLRILDCAAGPSSFAAETARAGGCVVAVDPLYAHEEEAIAARVEVARTTMMAAVRAERHRFIWTRFASPEALEVARMGAMERFLADYEAGRREGRYRVAALPHLPFESDCFELVLASHFLFLYSAQFGLGFHLSALEEMLRVGAEARVFPLLDLQGKPSAHLPAVMAALKGKGYRVELRKVDYEFQAGGDEMLLVGRAA